MKQRLSAILLVLPLLSFAPVTYAAVGNSNTGADSVNIAELEISNTKTVDNENSGFVDNQVCVKTSTGGNEIEGNTGGGNHSGEALLGFNPVNQENSSFEPSRSGEINTGDANAKIEINNSLNENKTDVNQNEEPEEDNVSPTEGTTPTTPSESGGVSAAGGETPTTLPSAGSNSIVLASVIGLAALALLLLRRRALHLVK